MSAPQRRSRAATLFLWAWGFLTMVLVFLVVLLVQDMIRRGMDPLATAPAEAMAPEDDPLPEPEIATAPAPLYFAAPGRLVLAPEERLVPRTGSTVENCRAAIETLIEGPRTGLAPLFPATTRLLAVYLLEDGTLVVDFSRELARDLPRSASAEAFAAYGLAQTVTDAALRADDGARVRRVRVLIEGTPPGGPLAHHTNFPGHIDLLEPIEPHPAWVSAEPQQSR